MYAAARPDERPLCPCCGFTVFNIYAGVPLGEACELADGTPACIDCFLEDAAHGRCPCGAAVEDTKHGEDGDCAVCHGDPEATGIDPDDLDFYLNYEPLDREY